MVAFAILAIGVVVTMLFYLKWINTYWQRKGITYLQPTLFFGSLPEVFLQRKSLTEKSLEIYKEIKAKDKKHGGLWSLTSPIYFPIDIEIVKGILLKDFDHFMDHGYYLNEKREPLTGHLFNLEGARWKSLRAKLTPIFTSSKMKMMFHTMVDCTAGLKQTLLQEAQAENPVAIKNILARFTTDIIGSCAFGLDCNCQQNPNSEFEINGKRIFKLTFFENISRSLCMALPYPVSAALGLKSVAQDVSDFFLRVLKDTLQHREKNNVYRNDFVQLLLQLNNDSKKAQDVTLTENEMAAQCFAFFGAGFETSSTLMTFALYELSREENQPIQEKLRKEINQVLRNHDDKLTYEGVMEMSYLDKVVHETLRRYSPLSVTPRVCTKDYKIPGTDITLEKGNKVWIPIAGIHMDPEYYPNPEVFDPEHFNEENKSSRPNFTWLPFGEGPRICIGGDNAETFRNRKGYFSINVQTVSDPNLKIMDIVARWPGSVHDQTIFNNSNIKQRFENGEFRNSILVADSGYANTMHVATPLLQTNTAAEELYNESGARFGLLQSKIGLITIFRNFKITLNENTKLPLKLSPQSFLLDVKGDVWLNISKIKA